MIVLARDDIARIASGLFYLSSTQGKNAALQNPRSMSLLEAAQKVEPGAAFPYNEEGYRWFQQDQKRDAASAFDAALTRDPTSAPALNNLGITYFSLGDLPQAAHYLQEAVGQDPDNAISRYNLGILLMQLQDPSGAIREFRESGFIDPKAASPPLQEAYLYQQIGDYADTEPRARSALHLDPSLAPAHILLGIALYNQGKEAEALASFTQALSLQPGNRTAAFYQADPGTSETVRCRLACLTGAACLQHRPVGVRSHPGGDRCAFPLPGRAGGNQTLKGGEWNLRGRLIQCADLNPIRS